MNISEITAEIDWINTKFEENAWKHFDSLREEEGSRLILSYDELWFLKKRDFVEVRRVFEDCPRLPSSNGVKDIPWEDAIKGID